MTKLSAPALARLREMLKTGSHHGLTIEPELMRGGYVVLFTRGPHGARWDITPKGREAVASGDL